MIKTHSLRRLIRCLRLKKHPEGGYYRETYRSAERITKTALPRRYPARRNMATAIYYLLPRGEFSAFHRIQSDEVWHFYDGAPLDLALISTRGVFSKVRLGLALGRGERPQILIPRGTWFAAAPAAAQAPFTLAGCTVAPGFDFADFEMAARQGLLKKYPLHRRWILKWTRGR